jgi:AAHS family benzoate transporter-like MFS transporter
MLEGYDLGSFGVTVPSILADDSLGASTTVAGILGALTPVGMFLGAAIAGMLVRRVGPRRLILVAGIVFSAGMALCAIAPSVPVLGLGRAIVGLGLGVMLPTLIGFVADLTVPGRRARTIGIVMAGQAFGGLSAPLLGALILPGQSFRWIYVIGVIPALVAIPLAWVRFPESPVHLLRTNREPEAQAVLTALDLPRPVLVEAGRKNGLGLGMLFQPGVRAATILFWLTSAVGLLLVFAMGTWLPTIMQTAGFDLGSALLLTAVLWTGAGVGMIVGGRLADIAGPKRMVVIAFLIGAVSLVLIAMQPPLILLLVLTFIAGFGLIGSQALVNSLIATRYPDDLRGNGLNWALAAGRPGAMVGPLLGAWVLTSGLAFQWNFYVFAIVGVLGAIFALFVPRIRIVETTTAREQA